jgi:hypothetical protein
LKNPPIKRLEIVGSGEMKKRRRAGRKVGQQPKAAKATAPGGDVAKVDSASPISVSDFNPIEIRGEPLSVTVLRERR